MPMIPETDFGTPARNAATLVTLGGFGIEQQRSSIFALYNAFAESADGNDAAKATRDEIGQSLFPLDANNQLLSPFKVAAADHTAAIAAVKGKLKM